MGTERVVGGDTEAVALSWLEAPPTGDDPDAERRRQAIDLVEAVGGRDAVEQLHAGFLARLHRASNDFGATEGLRITQEALKTANRPR